MQRTELIREKKRELVSIINDFNIIQGSPDKNRNEIADEEALFA